MTDEHYNRLLSKIGTVADNDKYITGEGASPRPVNPPFKHYNRKEREAEVEYKQSYVTFKR